MSIHDTLTVWMTPALHAMISPPGSEFEMADGRHIALGILEESFWRNLCEALGHLS